MAHKLACLVAAIALLTLPLPALARDDLAFSAERKAGIDTTGAERVEILARAGDIVIRGAQSVQGTVRVP